MKSFMTEKDFQRHIIDYVVRHNGYRLRTDADVNHRYFFDEELLFEFLERTQPKAMAALKKSFKEKCRAIFTEYLNKEICRKDSSLVSVLKHGVEIGGQKLYLLYPKPATEMNDELIKKYRENIFSIAEEVWASDTERIDLVVFLNGLAIMTFELKCPAAGQTWGDAVAQYKRDRDPENRLFLFRAGAFVHFAMDTEECYMTTRLEKGKTVFLPFNRGKGKGVRAGAGNSPVKGRFATSYLWEDILRGDTILELVTKFLFLQKDDDKKPKGGKAGNGETMIFPRFHQLDAVRKLLADVKENGTANNYLIQHSAGSGKTNTIAWLAHRLASLHDDNDETVVDQIIIMTDRVVVDRQLQKAITTLEHKDGLIKVMDEDCSSADLAKALTGNTKIIATTIQKFPHILEKVYNLKAKRFAVIIDEAHSSTAGRNMAAVTKALASAADEDLDAEDVINAELGAAGKQLNVAMFAFTATPKPQTLQLFGSFGVDEEHPAEKAAFHIYSMKQAIEEGFILDVLRNYTTYETHYEIVKKIDDDPLFKEKKAKNKIRRFAMLHDTNVAQRVEIIVEHFRDRILGTVNGEEKAMVITASRKEAVLYHEAITKYLAKKGYADMKALVAFSGTVHHDGHDLTEAGMNGIAENKLKEAFRADAAARFLVVANKYQTGYDEKKLCAMYVMKSLDGIAAVQTLSRLNRIWPPYEKRTFVLDFSNTTDDIAAAFAPYYTSTILSDTVTAEKMYELAAEIDGYGIIDNDDVNRFWELSVKNSRRPSSKIKAELTGILNETKVRFDKKDEKERKEFRGRLGTFNNWYEFIIQASTLEDHGLFKKDHFIRIFAMSLNPETPPETIDIAGKVDAREFEQEKKEEIEKKPIESRPELQLKGVKGGGANEDWDERLSVIIREINSRTGKNFPDANRNSIKHIEHSSLEDRSLEDAAETNAFKDFKLLFDKRGKDIIADSYESDRDFYETLLNDEDAARLVLDAISRKVYDELRGRSRRRDSGAYRLAAHKAKGDYEP